MNNHLVTASISFITALATKGATGPAQTIEDLWFLAFGQWVSPLAEKRKIVLENKLDNFKVKVINEIDKIPKENMQEPKISILGPALEASKYYYDEDDLRDMFSKLIAASLDSSKNRVLRTSFVEIIKQLEPLDASNLKTFEKSNILPIATYSISDSKKLGFSTILDIMFSSNPDHPKIDMHSSSLYNLQRLGLVEINSTDSLTDESNYDIFMNDPIANLIHIELQKGAYGPDKIFNLIKGYIKLTSLGKDFISICF